MRHYAHTVRSSLTPTRVGLLIVVAAIGAVFISVAAGASKKAVVVADPADGASGAVDITRISLGAASRNRLKLNIRAAAPWEESDLLASSGPPGSICVKLWTKSDPPDQTPDYLVCVTSTKDEDLRASVLQWRANRLPKLVSRATIDKSGRSVTLMFRQRSIGSPSTIRFAGESTKPGCIKSSCIDLAPNAPKTGRLKLTASATTGT